MTEDSVGAFIPGERTRRTGAASGPLAGLSFAAKALFDVAGTVTGYGHPEWRHGGYKGELAVEREDIVLSGVDFLRPENLHIQALSHVTLTLPGEAPVRGMGVFEQLILGPYRPYGFS